MIQLKEKDERIAALEKKIVENNKDHQEEKIQMERNYKKTFDQKDEEIMRKDWTVVML